jgi:16S rRNA processing protein RimM
LIGLDVYEEEDYLGVLTEILQTGANDVYLVTDKAGKETLIPDTDEVVLDIDVNAGIMRVAKMKWYGEGD